MEASLVLSVFLFFFLCILYLYSILLTELKIQEALEQTADIQAAYAASEFYNSDRWEELSLSSLLPALDRGYTSASVISITGRNFLNKSCIRGGASGLNFAFCRYLVDGENLELIISYKVKLPFFGISDMEVVQCAKRRVWYGYDSSGKRKEKKKTENPVYVTENGEAYHLFSDCSYIDVKVQGVNADQIEKLRNKDGAKYYPCEVCHPDYSGTVYIAAYGTRYHKSEECIAIERDAKEIEFSKVGTRHLCSRCQKRAAGNS